MNNCIFMGRLTKDPEVRYGGEANDKAVARFTIAVDRRFKRQGEPDADFFNCVAFGRQAEFVEKYLHQGTKILMRAAAQNNNYTNRDGQKVYGIQFVAEEIEFAESKNAQGGGQTQAQAKEKAAKADPAPAAAPVSNFVPVEDEDDELPFN